MSKINPELIDTINKHFDSVDDKEDALMLAMCLYLNNIMFLYRRGIVKSQDEEDTLFKRFRILFVQEDPDNDTVARKFKLKIPLFVSEVEESQWDIYYKWLVKNLKLSAQKGRFSQTIEGKEAFKELQLIKGFDLARLQACTEAYYMREGQYAKALPKFLVENARGEYEGYKEVKSKLI